MELELKGFIYIIIIIIIIIIITMCPDVGFILGTTHIHRCHTAAMLSRETKRALFYHAIKASSGNHGDEA